MHKTIFVLGLIAFVAVSAHAQDRFVFLGGFPVGADPIVKPEALPIPVFSAAAEAGLIGPAKARVTFTYGLGHTIFKTPCADCKDPFEVDATNFDAKAPLAASMDALFGHQVSPRLWVAGFGGLGMSLAIEGSVNLRIPRSYRMETHMSTYATYGADLAVKVFREVEAVTQLRGATFFIGDRKFVPATYDEFTADAGTVTGFVLLLGVRVKS